MNSRQRVKRVISHKPTDKLPKLDSFWEDTVTEWIKTGAGDYIDEADIVYTNNGEPDYNMSLHRAFGFDINMVFLDNSFRLESKILKDDGDKVTIRDRSGFTVDKFAGKSSTLHMYDYVTAGREDWERLKKRLIVDVDGKSRIGDTPFFLNCEPNPDWETAAERFKDIYSLGKYTMINSFGPFEAVWRHRGFENLLIDTVMDETLFMEMAMAHTDLIIETMKKAFEYEIKPDGYFLTEDLGHTKGLLFSPETYRRTIHICHKKLGEFLHDNDMDFIMHSCGRIEELIPLFIKEGLDVLQGIEAKAGQNVVELQKEYGSNLAFMGNVDVTMLAGGRDKVESEIEDKIIPAMKNGGYVYHSDHSIPPEVPWDDYFYLMKKLDSLTF